jgi:hypothetical protein
MNIAIFSGGDGRQVHWKLLTRTSAVAMIHRVSWNEYDTLISPTPTGVLNSLLSFSPGVKTRGEQRQVAGFKLKATQQAWLQSCREVRVSVQWTLAAAIHFARYDERTLRVAFLSAQTNLAQLCLVGEMKIGRATGHF